jgi:hypothetical protein
VYSVSGLHQSQIYVLGLVEVWVINSARVALGLQLGSAALVFYGSELGWGWMLAMPSEQWAA